MNSLRDHRLRSMGSSFSDSEHPRPAHCRPSARGCQHSGVRRGRRRPRGRNCRVGRWGDREMGSSPIPPTPHLQLRYGRTVDRPVRLKKYEILHPLATGGMAEVHLARTTGPEGIEKLLVIKRLLPELAQNKQFVRMFLDEARLAVALDHVNIVQVYDVDEVDGAVFYAMEFLHGRDVRQIARRLRARGIRLPLEQALAILIPTCAALHYAHEMTGT